MPIIDSSSYRPPPGLWGGHLQTIYPALVRRVSRITTQRERLETPDGDFLDLDWKIGNGCRRVAILTHGLEGGAGNTYIQGMAAAFFRKGWDVLAWNFRGCSQEPNRLLRSYHSGETGDLQTVIAHALSTGRYGHLGLIGFSLGGNVTLKYLGDAGNAIDPRVAGAVVFSVPCDLASSSRKLENFTNRIYMHRFLVGLRKKIREKMQRFPGQLHDEGLDKMRTFQEFDGAYTAPIHGFLSAGDYWKRASSRPVLPAISRPTLMVNARNDPFLAPACFPFAEAAESRSFHFEAPHGGGHVGFVSFNTQNQYWSETRALEFLEGL
jgi:predicted alpha/beta-fold hydrolase